MKRLKLPVAILALSWVVSAIAADITYRDYSRDERTAPNEGVEDFVWKEGEVALPDFPKEENLLEFDVDSSGPGTRFSYFIDKESLSIGEVDSVVRFTLVVRSRTGGQNVTYEGIRCNIREYKSYAFGNGKGEWRKARKPLWKEFRRSDYTQYRFALWKYYLCDRGTEQPHPIDDMLRAIKYPNSGDNTRILWNK
ncbi:MAG: CNP1-like family protein [Sedimenticola sp.]